MELRVGRIRKVGSSVITEPVFLTRNLLNAHYDDGLCFLTVIFLQTDLHVIATAREKSEKKKKGERRDPPGMR